MAKENKKKNSGGGGAPNNVVHLARCPVSDCGKKPARLGFCAEHFEWFKVGLVTRKGERPSDFDKKFQAFKRRKAA